jgi:hypothetical protein
MLGKIKPGFNVLIGPKAVPSVQTDEYLYDVWIHELHITNPSAGTITVTVQDRQSPTPRTLIPGIALEPGGMISLDSETGRAMPGGITWAASGPGLDGYIIGLTRNN